MKDPVSNGSKSGLADVMVIDIVSTRTFQAKVPSSQLAGLPSANLNPPVTGKVDKSQKIIIDLILGDKTK